MTYALLQTQVADYMHRTDLTANMPTFIALAESMLFRELKVKDLETSVTGTTSGGSIALPDDFDSVSRVTITYASSERSLDYASRPEDYVSGGTVPKYYALEKDALRLFPAASGYTYTLYYIPIIPALSDSQTTNWLLTNARDLYLYASALEAAKYARDAAETAKLNDLVAPMLDSVRRLSERRGQPANGSLQVKPRR